MKRCLTMQVYRVMFVCLLWGMANVTDTAAQAGNWQTFKREVFQLVEVVIQMVKQEEVPKGELTLVRDDVSRLEQKSYALQCPSPQECESLRYILAKLRTVVNFTPGAVFSVEQGKEIAILRQAAHNFFTTVQQPVQASVAQQSAQATPTNASHQTSALQFSIGYAYKPGGKGDKFQDLRDGGVMHSGDHYKILFKATEKCYVYIFQADSANKIYGVFPLADFKGVALELKNPVQPNQVYIVPAKDKSFVLDNVHGTEQIYFLAFRQRDSELEQLYQEVVEAQNSGNARQVQLAQAKLAKAVTVTPKGVATVISDTAVTTQSVEKRTEENTISLLQQRLHTCEGCVSVTTFHHE